MPPPLFDFILLAGILGFTYVMTSEGLWGAALMFFNVLFGAIIAFNFYEPMAQIIVENASFISHLADMTSLMLLFSASVMVLRVATEFLAPAMIRFPSPVYNIGRFIFAFGTSVIVFAVILLGLHAAPVHQKIASVVDYKHKPPFNFGIDHMWLAFFQKTTGEVFPRFDDTGIRDPFRQFGRPYGQSEKQRLKVHVFDPRAKWLLDHQEARPFGESPVLEEAPTPGAAAAGAAGATGGPAAGPGGQPVPGKL
jgi:uncharacterized membrane protein required for colicin V production